MLTYFHNHKFRYEKGQLAPIFIAVLVILIIAAMVTVNLSKVAFIKTDSSNAVDAGALAAGSAMANVFNAVAQANSQMETDYWMFYTGVLVSFVIALAYLTSALAQACTDPCSALEAIGMFIGVIKPIGVAVTAYSLGQYHFFYLPIRKMAKERRESAIKLGHQFSFINSGISSKLKKDSPPPEIVDPEKMKNYRDIYKQFLDGLGDNEKYPYAWQDGQDRAHSVESTVSIDEVDTFELQVTALNSPEIATLLLGIGILAYAAEKALGGACACYLPCVSCCNPFGCEEGCPCCPVYLAECAAAVGLMIPIFPLMLDTLAGLLPGDTITDTNGNVLLYIICWIDDIVHNRLVRAETTQHHEGGADLGLWQMRYPDTQSYSIVNFEWHGEIYPPYPHFDPSIIDTDKLN